jgi:pilus assembly protein Flp/PilA
MLAYIRKVANHKNDEGASAVEYGLLVAAIAAVIVLIVFALGRLISDAFNDTCTAVETRPGATNEAACN